MAPRHRLNNIPALSGGIGTLGAKLVAYAAGAVVSVLIARALGPHERGVWSLSLLVASILGLLADGGLSTSVLFSIRSCPGRIRAAVRMSGWFVFLGGILWMLLTLLLAAGGYLPLGGVPKRAVVLAAAGSLLAAGTGLRRQALNGLGDLSSANASLLLQALTLPAILLPAIFIIGPTADIALGAYVVCLVATFMGTVWLRDMQRLPGPDWDSSLTGPLLRYGLKSQAVTLALLLAYRSDLFLVNAYLGVAAAGVYSVALTLSEILRGIAETAQMLVVAQAANPNLTARAEAVARQAVLATMAAGLLMAAVSHMVVPVLFGQAYRGASPAFWCLVPGVVGLALSYCLSPLLFLEGRVLVNAIGAFTGLATLWLAATRGPGEPSLVKVALSSSLAYWVLAMVQVLYLRHERRVRLSNLVPAASDAVALLRRLASVAPRTWSHGW
jgi:O-antigen/teichoic acid export membrane protein